MAGIRRMGTGSRRVAGVGNSIQARMTVRPAYAGKAGVMLEGAAAQWSMRREDSSVLRFVGWPEDVLPMGELVRAIDEGLRGHVSLLSQAMESAVFPPRRGRVETHRSLDLVYRECRQIADALDDVREIGRLLEGGVPRRRERVALSELVDEALATIRPRLDGRGSGVQRHLPSATQWVEVDRGRFVRTLVELLMRVIERVEIGQEVVLEGFSDRAGHRLVARLEPTLAVSPRRDAARPPDLDLILARCLVRGHGGHFTLDDALRLWLPRALIEEVPREGVDVLIIDGSKDAALSLHRLLTGIGCRVRTCGGLTEAATAMSNRRADVLLIDLELAAGLDFSPEHWVAAAGVQGVPPIVVGLGDPPDHADRPRGFREILPRPIRLEQLRRYVEVGDIGRPHSASA